MRDRNFYKSLVLSLGIHLVVIFVTGRLEMIQSVSESLGSNSVQVVNNQRFEGAFSKSTNTSIQKVQKNNDVKPSASPVGSTQGISNLDEIRSAIYSRKEYPKYSRIKSEEGEVIIGFKMNQDGFLSERKIIKPSQYLNLNKAALKLIESIDKIQLQVRLNKDTYFEIPIQYSLK